MGFKEWKKKRKEKEKARQDQINMKREEERKKKARQDQLEQERKEKARLESKRLLEEKKERLKREAEKKLRKEEKRKIVEKRQKKILKKEIKKVKIRYNVDENDIGDPILVVVTLKEWNRKKGPYGNFTNQPVDVNRVKQVAHSMGYTEITNLQYCRFNKSEINVIFHVVLSSKIELSYSSNSQSDSDYSSSD